MEAPDLHVAMGPGEGTLPLAIIMTSGNEERAVSPTGQVWTLLPAHLIPQVLSFHVDMFIMLKHCLNFTFFLICS